jgi:phenylacetate-CoA ligase
VKIHSVSELVAIARKSSPFYAALYKNVDNFTSLTDLPVLNSADFWKANTIEGNLVLTEKHRDGIVFKSGGTTGNPKFSFFRQSEWDSFTHAFGEGMEKGGLTEGERIANLFYAGDLYASFMFISKSIEKSGVRAVQFPLSGGADFNHIVETINSFKVTTWAGVPTSIMKLAEYAQAHTLHPPTKILFGGESLYEDQIEFIKNIFPSVHVQSIGYASVDGGLLGFADATCLLQEHRVFSDHTIMEILDEDTLEPIVESNRAGKMFLTNLTRSLMPIIRYPVGDKAMWIDDASVVKYRKFKILGRSDEGARIGPATVYYEDLHELLYKFHDVVHIKGFQIRLVHFENKDQLVIRLAVQNAQSENKKLILDTIYSQREFLKELVDRNLIHPLLLEFVSMNDLETNARTGKLKRIIDVRR